VLDEALRSCRAVDSAVLYGSVARGDAESYSDIDLLVVCDEEKKLTVYDELYRRLSPHFKKLSLCIYGPKELRFLAKAGSLFLLHLQKEAIPLLDHSGLLSEVLDGFEIKSSYDDDFVKSLELISPLDTAVYGAPNQLHRLAYTYSLFRVYGVYLLAQDRVFEFSKAKMAATLVEKNPSQAKNVTQLSSLRVLNTNFFTGEPSSGQARSVVADLSLLRQSTAALGELVGRTFDVTERSYYAAVQEFLAACAGSPSALGYRMRSWFLLLIYDGLNLYARSHRRQELTSFSEDALLELTDPGVPKPVIAAAAQGLSYIRNYHVKYFFSEERRIRADKACRLLEGLTAFA